MGVGNQGTPSVPPRVWEGKAWSVPGVQVEESCKQGQPPPSNARLRSWLL